MELIHPRDLDAWSRWARPSLPRRAVAAARRRGRPEPVAALRLVVLGAEPRALVAMDSANASSRAAAWSALAHRGEHGVAVLAEPAVLDALLDGEDRPARAVDVASPADLDVLAGSVRSVLGLGHYLAAGRAAWEWARSRDLPYFVAQHGLITPFAPPLPAGSTLLAFSEQDGDFWTRGSEAAGARVVGSQALYEAARVARPAVVEAPTVFLGQLHGRELGRVDIARQTVGFLRANPGIVYRPHPSEKDVLSRAAHAAMRRAGVEIDAAGRPLPELGADVVSVFSTGVLEAVAGGRRGWVHHAAPPAWLEDFWSRYGMARWIPGVNAADQPAETSRAAVPVDEPARAVARIVFEEETA